MEDNNDLIADLNRRATQAKRLGDMNEAVALLVEAKKLHGDFYDDTRLALFLQQAGRFDEAMREFEQLLASVEWQIWESLSHQPDVIKKSQIASRRNRIHEKMKLACKREKKHDLAELHAKLEAQYFAEWKALETAAESIRASRNGAWSDAKKHGIKAVREFLGVQIKERQELIDQSLEMAKTMREAGQSRKP